MLIGVIGGYLAEYCLNLLVSNSMDADAYGDYRVAYEFAIIAGVLVVFGGDRATPKFLSGDIEDSDCSGVWEYLRLFFGISLILSAWVIAFTALGVFVHTGPADVRHYHPVLVAACIVPLIAFGFLLRGLLEAARYVGRSNLPWRLGLPLGNIALVFLLYQLIGSLNASQAILIVGFTTFAICLWQWRQARRLQLIPVQRRPGHYPLARTLKTSLPMMLAALIGLAMAKIDLMLLEILLTDEREVGHYAAATLIAQVIIIIQVAVISLFAPLIATTIDAEQGSAKSLFWQGQGIVFGLCLFLSLILFLFGTRFLGMFGADFLGAAWSLKILTLAYFFWALCGLSSIWLQYSEKGDGVVWVTGVAAIGNVLANYLLIPIYGINGGAMATMISMSTASVCIMWIHWRLSRRS